MIRILTKKQIVLLVSLLLATLTVAGVTLAWLTAKTGTIQNTFTPGVVDISVTKAGSGNSYSLTVTNVGTVPAFVRVAAVDTYKNGNNIHYQPQTLRLKVTVG